MHWAIYRRKATLAEAEVRLTRPALFADVLSRARLGTAGRLPAELAKI